MDKNLLIQTIAVGIIILVALIWIVLKVVSQKDKGACHGCSLADNCSKKSKNPSRKNKNNCEP